MMRDVGEWIDIEAEKKTAETRSLEFILAAYRELTGEAFSNIIPSETPDFIAVSAENESVGIELTRLKFEPDYMSERRAIGEAWADDEAAFLRTLALSHVKGGKLTNGSWPHCQRRILFIELIDYPLSELKFFFGTDVPTNDGFSEIWLADFTTLEIYGRIRLFALVHPDGAELELPEIELGKPYG